MCRFPDVRNCHTPASSVGMSVLPASARMRFNGTGQQILLVKACGGQWSLCCRSCACIRPHVVCTLEMRGYRACGYCPFPEVGALGVTQALTPRCAQNGCVAYGIQHGAWSCPHLACMTAFRCMVVGICAEHLFRGEVPARGPTRVVFYVWLFVCTNMIQYSI